MMDTPLFFGQMGTALAIGLAAVGSALGCGVAGQSAAGAWAKDAKAGKGIRFVYVILVALPITQTLYGMIVMNSIAEKLAVAGAHAGLLFGVGLATGLGELLSAWMQGAIGAAGCRMLSESDGKGFALVIIAMGIAESVGLLVFVFMRGPLGTIVVGG